MTFDLAILGNGIASNVFARTILRSYPETKIAIVGPGPKNRYLVGESVTELASHFFSHELGLGSLLHRHHLYKHGLRFFFDSPEHDLPVERMSEEASGHFPVFRTFHIDHYRFLIDLQKLNKDDGVVFIETEIGQTDFVNDQHVLTFDYSKDLQASQLTSQWLVSATGRDKTNRSREQISEKNRRGSIHSSAWAHYKSQNSIDDINKNHFRERIGYVSREFSTVHFLYEGYWFWLIPQPNEVVSVGLVYDEEFVFSGGSPSREDFESFLESHRALSSLFSRESCLNYGASRSYLRRSEWFIKPEERKALIGDACGFIDPLYSTGLDITVRQCSILSRIVGDDMTTKATAEELEERAETARFLVSSYYEFYEILIPGKNICMGSMELWSLKYFWEFFSYHVDILWPFLKGSDPFQAPLKNHVRLIDRRIRTAKVLTRNFVELAQAYLRDGLYYRKNANFVAFSAIDIFVHDPKSQGLIDLDFGDYDEIWFDLVCFTLIAQIQLYTKRSDLLSDRSFYQQVTQIFQNWLRLDDPSTLWESCLSVLNDLHRGDQGAEFFGWVVEDEGSYWRAWYEEQRAGVETKTCGRNFERIRSGKPRSCWNKNPSEGCGISIPKKVISSFSRFVSLPEAFFSDDRFRAVTWLTPFQVEGVACGLALEGKSYETIEARLLHLLPATYRVFVLVGVGMAASRNLAEIAWPENLPTSDTEEFINGFGFQMGLDFSQQERFDVTLPSVEKRQPFVIGLGRSVTFSAIQSNHSSKYEAAFQAFGLYPEDRNAFYHGAGFSLAFSQEGAHQDGAIFFERLGFASDLVSCLQDGWSAALHLRSRLNQDCLLPTSVLSDSIDPIVAKNERSVMVSH